MDRLILPFTGSVHIEVYDKDGNLLNVIDRHNEETIWAKLHTPSDIYMDLITKDLKQEFGVDDLGKIIKTAFNQVNRIRSGLLNVHFSRSGNVYSASYQWGNDTDETVYLYGLVSYSSDNVYTIFDMSNNPVEIPPGSMIVGRYQITYDKPTPAVPSPTTKKITVNDNKVMGGLLEPTSPSLRQYKYSRVFIKTSDYLGLDPNDTDINSHVLMTVASSDDYKRAWGQTAIGQLGYKFLSSGNPGGANGVRYVSYYRADQRTRVVSGNVFYHIRSYLYPIVDSSNYCDKMFGYTNALALNINPDAKEVRPWKFNFIDPDKVQHFKDTTWDWNGRGLYCQKYTTFLPRFIYKGVRDYVAQDVMYLYWDVDNPRLVVFAYSYGNMNCSVTINGTTYTPTSITNIGDRNRKIEFDLTGLTAGEGIVVFKFWNAYSMLNTNNGTGYIYFVGPKFLYAGDFYGYVVPFAGFLGKETSEINSNWISAGLASINDEVKDLNFELSDDDISNLGLVSGVKLEDIYTKTDHQYWVWVKASEKDKLAGEISLYTHGKIFTMWGRYDWNHTNTHVAPVYVGDNNFITFRPTNVDEVDELTDYLGLEGLLEDTYSLQENNHITVDSINREVTWLDDAPLNILSTSTKSYIVRKVGDTNYNIRVPEALSDYTEGTATVTYGSNNYEFETVIQQTENISNLTVNFTTDTVFASGEFVTVPITDGDGAIVADKLETWAEYETYNMATTDATVVADESSGTDEILQVVNDGTANLYSNTGRIMKASVKTLADDVTLDRNQNYKMVIRCNVPYNHTDRVAVRVPKRVKDGADWRYTNLETIVVTNGHHVIPWRLVSYSEYGKLIDSNTLLQEDENYIILLSTNVMHQIMGDNPRNKEIVLDVFFKADTLNDILPIDIDFYAGYAPPLVDRVDAHLENDGSTAQFVYYNTDNNESTATVTTSGITYPDNASFTFSTTNRSSMYIDKPSDFSIDFNQGFSVAFKIGPIDDKTDVATLMQFYNDNNHKLDLILDENNKLLVRVNGKDVIQPLDFDTTIDNYIEISVEGEILTLFLNGKMYVSADISQITSWFSSVNRIYICSENSDTQFVSTTVSKVAFFNSLLWRHNHESSTYDKWLKSPGIAYQANQAIIKCILPYALPKTIDVLDESGNHVDFCSLNFANLEAELNNVLFIKIPLDLKYDSKYIGFSTMPTIPMPATLCHYGKDLYTAGEMLPILGNDADLIVDKVDFKRHNIINYTLQSLFAESVSGYNSPSTTAYIGYYMKAIPQEKLALYDIESYLSYDLVKKYISKDLHIKLKVIVSASDKSTTAESFFDKYIYAGNINSFYSDFQGTDQMVLIPESKHLSFTTDDAIVEVSLAKGMLQSDAKQNITRVGILRYTTNDALPILDSAIGHASCPANAHYYNIKTDKGTLTVSGEAIIYSLLSYTSPMNADWTYRYLSCYDYGVDYNYNLAEDFVYFAEIIYGPLKLTPSKAIVQIFPKDSKAPYVKISNKYFINRVNKILKSYVATADDIETHPSTLLKEAGWLYPFVDTAKPYKKILIPTNKTTVDSPTVFNMPIYKGVIDTDKATFIENSYYYFDQDVDYVDKDVMPSTKNNAKITILRSSFVRKQVFKSHMNGYISCRYYSSHYLYYNLSDIWNDIDFYFDSIYWPYISYELNNIYTKKNIGYSLFSISPEYNTPSTDLFNLVDISNLVDKDKNSMSTTLPNNAVATDYLDVYKPNLSLVALEATSLQKPAADIKSLGTLNVEKVGSCKTTVIPLLITEHQSTKKYYLLNENLGHKEVDIDDATGISISLRAFVGYNGQHPYIDPDDILDNEELLDLHNITTTYCSVPNEHGISVVMYAKFIIILNVDMKVDCHTFSHCSPKQKYIIEVNGQRFVNQSVHLKAGDLYHIRLVASATFLRDAYCGTYPSYFYMTIDNSDYTINIENLKKFTIPYVYNSQKLLPVDLYDYIQDNCSIDISNFDYLLDSLDSNTKVTVGVMLLNNDLLLAVSEQVKSITWLPELNDYNEIPHLYYNSTLDIYSQNADMLIPDSANYKAKVYNPNDYAVNNYPILLDLNEINLDAFTNGIVASINNADVPTVYADTNLSPTTDHSKWDRRHVWIKIPTIGAKSSLDVLIQDKQNNYMVDDVFDHIIYSGNLNDTVDIQEYNFVPDSITADDGSDYSARFIYIEPEKGITSGDNCLVLKNITPTLATVKQPFTEPMDLHVSFRMKDETVLDFIFYNATETPDLKFGKSLSKQPYPVGISYFQVISSSASTLDDLNNMIYGNCVSGNVDSQFDNSAYLEIMSSSGITASDFVRADVLIYNHRLSRDVYKGNSKFCFYYYIDNLSSYVSAHVQGLRSLEKLTPHLNLDAIYKPDGTLQDSIPSRYEFITESLYDNNKYRAIHLTDNSIVGKYYKLIFSKHNNSTQNKVQFAYYGSSYSGADLKDLFMLSGYPHFSDSFYFTYIHFRWAGMYYSFGANTNVGHGYTFKFYNYSVQKMYSVDYVHPHMLKPFYFKVYKIQPVDHVYIEEFVNQFVRYNGETYYTLPYITSDYHDIIIDKGNAAVPKPQISCQYLSKLKISIDNETITYHLSVNNPDKELPHEWMSALENDTIDVSNYELMLYSHTGGFENKIYYIYATPKVDKEIVQLKNEDTYVVLPNYGNMVLIEEQGTPTQHLDTTEVKNNINAYLDKHRYSAYTIDDAVADVNTASDLTGFIADLPRAIEYK